METRNNKLLMYFGFGMVDTFNVVLVCLGLFMTTFIITLPTIFSNTIRFACTMTFFVLASADYIVQLLDKKWGLAREAGDFKAEKPKAAHSSKKRRTGRKASKTPKASSTSFTKDTLDLSGSNNTSEHASDESADEDYNLRSILATGRVSPVTRLTKKNIVIASFVRDPLAAEYETNKPTDFELSSPTSTTPSSVPKLSEETNKTPQCVGSESDFVNSNTVKQTAAAVEDPAEDDEKSTVDEFDLVPDCECDFEAEAPKLFTAHSFAEHASTIKAPSPISSAVVLPTAPMPKKPVLTAKSPVASVPVPVVYKPSQDTGASKAKTTRYAEVKAAWPARTRSPRLCYRCRKTGHMAKDCPFEDLNRRTHPASALAPGPAPAPVVHVLKTTKPPSINAKEWHSPRVTVPTAPVAAHSSVTVPASIPAFHIPPIKLTADVATIRRMPMQERLNDFGASVMFDQKYPSFLSAYDAEDSAASVAMGAAFSVFDTSF